MPGECKIVSRIEELSKRKSEIEAQIAALDARRRRSRKKDEDRLKWLLGNLIFDCLKTEPGLEAVIRRELPGRLTQRDRDRGLWEILFPDDEGDCS